MTKTTTTTTTTTRAAILCLALFGATADAFAKGNPPDVCEPSLRTGDAIRQRFYEALCVDARDPARVEKLVAAFRDPHPMIRRAAAARARVIAPERLDRFLESDDPFLAWFAAARDHSPAGVATMIARLSEAHRLWQREQTAARLIYYPAISLDHDGALDRYPPGTQANEALRLEALIVHQLAWLAEWGDARAVPVSVALLAHPQQPFALPAVTGLGAWLKERPTRMPDVVPAVAGLLALPEMNDGARAYAVELLLRWNAVDAAPLVLPLLDHASVWVRMDAARLLGGLRVPAAATQLVKLLDEPIAASTAAAALVQLGPAAVPPLTARLTLIDGRPAPRNAMVALGAIGPPARDAVPVLFALLDTGEPSDARSCSALLALAKIASNDPVLGRRLWSPMLRMAEHRVSCLNDEALPRVVERLPAPPTDALARLRALLSAPDVGLRALALDLITHREAIATLAPQLRASLFDHRRVRDLAYNDDYDAGLLAVHAAAIDRLTKSRPLASATRQALRQRRALRCHATTATPCARLRSLLDATLAK